MSHSAYVQDLLEMLTGRQRSKLRGRLKRRFGLNRRQVGAMGAGDLEPPPGYDVVLLGVLELIRVRRASLAAATPSRRPTEKRRRRKHVRRAERPRRRGRAGKRVQRT